MSANASVLGRICCMYALLVSCSIPPGAAADSSPASPSPISLTDSRHYNDDDPVTKLSITYPRDGGVATAPLQFFCELGVRTVAGYTAWNGDKLLCVESAAFPTKCSSLLHGKVDYDERDLPEGNYTARAYIVDAVGAAHLHESKPVSFSIVDDEAFEKYSDLLVEQSREEHQFPKDLDILEWAQYQTAHTTNGTDEKAPPVPTFTLGSDSSDLLLIIGIKTAVLTNFPRRQAIRETWANKATLPHDVKVFFLGCSPILRELSPRDQRRFQHAVALERSVYGDLLTEELDCEDAYRLLSDKVKAFLHFGAAEFPRAKFVMLTDDDSYVRVDHLVGTLVKESQLTPSYMGESEKSVLHKKDVPYRDPNSIYFVPETLYPMNEYPPFAAGAQYLLSMDSVRYIAKNTWRLRSLNGLEDVSTALWLLTTQVHVRHTPSFVCLRIRPCIDRAISIAEFSPLGLRSIHKNILHGRSLCDGYDRPTWQWQVAVSASDMLAQERDPDPGESLQLETYVRNVFDSGDHEVVTVLSTPSWAGIKTSYFPSIETLSAYSSRICAQAQRYFPGTFRGSSSCFRIAEVLHEHLRRNQRHFL